MKKRLLKALDARLGPALVRNARPRAGARELLGGVNRPLGPADISSILLIRPGGMGDAVLLLPLVAALRAHFPGARLDVLAERRNASAYEIEEPHPEVFRYDEAPFAVFRTLSRRRYDLVADTEQFHHLSTILANRLAPRYLCGFGTLGRRRLQTHSAPYSEDDYEVHSFLSLAEVLTGSRPEFDPDRPFLTPARRFRDWAAEALSPAGGRPLAALMPGAGSPHRLWPPARFAEVAAHLVGKGYGILIVGGPDALAASRTIAKALPPDRVLNLAGSLSLGQTAAVLEKARLCVTPDTGVLHVACAVGTSTVSLFGSGLERKWGPLGKRHVRINKGLPCSPCTRWSETPPCPRDYACMEAIAAADVIAAADWLLAETAP